MKTRNKIFGIFTSIVLVITIFITTKVFAQNYGTGDVSLSLDFSDNDAGYTINSVTVNGSNWTDGADKFNTSDGKYTIVATITAEEGKRPRIQWGGNWNNILNSNTTVNGNVYTITITANDVRNSVEGDGNPNNPFMGLSIKDDNNQQGVEPGPDGPQFDGKAYVIWSCNGGICYHYFDDIPNFDDGNSYFIKDTDIVADNNRNEKFDIKAEYKGWSTKNKFDRWVDNYKAYKNIEGNIDWTKVNPEDMLGVPVDMRQYEEDAIKNYGCTRNEPQDVFEDCVDRYVMSLGTVWTQRAQLQPVGEPQYNNAYVSYGDRIFKIVIYNKDYKGVSIGNLNDLNYYPAQWTNPYLRRDQFDISGTTKDKSTGIDTILLESTINIKTLNYNEFEIVKLEALDVPEDAVSINKVDGEWKIVFSSNFYDNVVFKATDRNNEISYFNIKRYTIDGWIRNDNHPILTADFYFDRTKSYNDFELSAKIVYKNGSEKNVKLKAVNRIDDGLGNITNEYEVDEENPEFGGSGKGLKRAVFEYDLQDGEDREIKDIYLNAEYKGSTETSYAGAFAGSGKGVKANIYHPEEEE